MKERTFLLFTNDAVNQTSITAPIISGIYTAGLLNSPYNIKFNQQVKSSSLGKANP